MEGQIQAGFCFLSASCDYCCRLLAIGEKLLPGPGRARSGAGVVKEMRLVWKKSAIVPKQLTTTLLC